GVLGFVANRAPSVVVAILLATPRIAAGRMDVSIGKRTYPYLDPCRRNRERLYPRKSRLIGYPVTLLVKVGEPMSMTPAPNAWYSVRHVAQVGRFCRIQRSWQGKKIGGD